MCPHVGCRPGGIRLMKRKEPEKRGEIPDPAERCSRKFRFQYSPKIIACLKGAILLHLNYVRLAAFLLKGMLIDTSRVPGSIPLSYQSTIMCFQESQASRSIMQGSRDVVLREIAFHLDVTPQQINYDANFTCNGGDSLSAIMITSACRSQQVNITVSTLMGGDSIKCILHDLDQADENCLVRGSISIKNEDNQIAGDRLETVQDTTAHDHASPATDMQLSLIYGSQTLAGRNIIRYSETYRTEDLPKVECAWRIVISTEPIFRAKFTPYKDTYYFTETDDAPFIWEEMTVTDIDTYQSALQDHNLRTDFMGVAFNVIHLRMNDMAAKTTVVWNIHHALMDGFSAMLVLNKHRNLLSGGTIGPSQSFVPFLDAVAIIRSAREIMSRRFWELEDQKIQAAKAELLLPHPVSPVNPSYAREDVTLPVPYRSLLQRAKDNGVTVASIFYAAWALTLSAYVDSNHVCFGIVLSGRTLPIPGSENVIGPLINTVPFQVSLEPFSCTEAYLKSVFSHSLELDRFQWNAPAHYAAQKAASTLDIHFELPLLHENPLGLTEKPETSIISDLPLRVSVQLDGQIELYYLEHRFCRDDIKRVGQAFATAVSALAAPTLTVGECQDQLFSLNTEEALMNGNFTSDATLSGAGNETLVDMFHQAALAYPGLTATEKGETVLTYASLASKVASLASNLSSYIAPGDVVCVHADRSVNWVIAIFAVLEAGGIYCPLDPEQPSDLRDKNFAESRSRIFLSTYPSCSPHRPRGCQLCLSVAELLEEDPNPGAVSPRKRKLGLVSSPDAGAYVCFTSGSSGSSKGVLCSHRSLVAFQKDFDVRLRARPGWRIGQIMSAAFDGSIHEIFSALSYGATLVLRSSNDPFEHLCRVDAAILIPSVARVLYPRDYPQLRVLYLVGESVPQVVCNEWAGRVTTFNMYGPTEATCGATIKELRPGQPPTLGRPNRSTRIYVLNRDCRLAPKGVIGEIFVAGVQVSHGYVNKPQETAERFLPDNIHGGAGERMYRTGDRGYWNEQGELCFCGRNDRQLKIRGFRVDLDDIEVRIVKAVRGCTGSAVTGSADGFLVAHIQPQRLCISEVKKALAEKLPSYMMPRCIVCVSEFPRTMAGKLDYKAIKPSTASAPYLSKNSSPPKLLDKVANVWKDVLGLSDVTLGEDSNFLELGGNSLSQLQLANRLSKLLGYSVPLMSVIHSSTLGGLVEGLQKPSHSPTTSSQEGYGWSSVSPIEQDWYLRYQLGGGSSSFNVAVAFQLGPTVDLLKLHSAWNLILARHFILRSRFRGKPEGNPYRDLVPDPPRVIRMDQIDIKHVTDQPFDITNDYLIRILLEPGMLVLVASHIILDYTSLNILLQEVSISYGGAQLKTPTPFTHHLRLGTATRASAEDEAFWQEYLGGLSRPTYSIGEWQQRSSYSGTSHMSRIPPETYGMLRQFARSHRMTMQQVSLAAVSLALQYNAEAVDIVLGVPHLGRRDSRDQEAVGLFLEPLPVRIRYPPPPSSDQPVSFPRSVQESSQRALVHALPWHQIVGAAGATAQLPDWPIFDVMVSCHESFQDVGMAGIDARPLYTWTQGSKFKLMVEFVVANDECLLMRLEYSDECFNRMSIAALSTLITAALSLILDEEPFEVMRESLSMMGGEEITSMAAQLELDPYGTKLEDL